MPTALCQCETYAFDGPLVFTLDLTRQCEASGGDGLHDHYVQVSRPPWSAIHGLKPAEIKVHQGQVPQLRPPSW